VTGLPFQPPGSEQHKDSLVPDSIPVKVRLHSKQQGLDATVDGTVVDVDTVEFVSPQVCSSRFGKLAEQDKTTLAAQLSVSMDGGRTWTKDVARAGQAELWISPWPHAGPTHVEPACAPASGGTELLFHVDLPSGLPDEALLVKFVGTPLQSVDDPDLQDRAGDLASLTPFDMTVPAWLDPGGRGIRCTTPAFNAEDVRLYTYTVELSLDGVVYLGRPLPFSVYHVRIVGLEPDLGPLLQPSQVRIMCKGLVHSEVHRVRLTFPESLGWAPRVVPGSLDHTTGEVSVSIPELSAEVRQRVDEEEAKRAADEQAAGEAPADGGDTAAEEAGEAKELPPVDPEGGLAGTEVVVELSLDGQNFTADGVAFAYHPRVEPGPCEMLAPPPGSTPEPPKEEDKKGKKGKSVVEEKPLEMQVLPGAKLGVELKHGATESAFAAIEVDLATRVGEEEPRPFKTVSLAATLESVAARSPTPVPEEPPAKGKKNEAAPPAPPPEDLPPRDMLTAVAPGFRSDELPEGAALLLSAFRVSLNGQCFVECPAGTVPMRLEPLPRSPTPQEA